MTPQEHQDTTIIKANWDGLALEHRRSTPGGADKPPLAAHFVTLNLGAGRDLWQQRDGRTRRHLQPYGEAVLVPAGCESRWKWRTPATVLALSIQPELVCRAAADMGRRGAFELTHSFGTDDPRLLHLGLALREEALTGGTNGPLFAQCLSTAVAAHLLTQYGNAPQRTAPSASGLSAPQMARVTSYIHDHLDASLSLADIAAVAHASPFHFARQFKRAAGRTLHQFVIDCRIDAAKRLLSRSEHSVGQIAGEVGFAQQSHLAAHFKRTTGLSPLAFRRQLGPERLKSHESAQNAHDFD